MTDFSVADERLNQVETLQRRLAEVARRAKEHPEMLPALNAGLQDVISGRLLSIPTVHLYGSDDPLSAYRKIKNLTFVGPKQWNMAMTGRNRKNRNPLGLTADWCPLLALPYTIDQMNALARFCETQEDWKTRVILYFALPSVGEVPISLKGQYNLWGVPHDNFGPGKVRQDIFLSNWYIKPNYDWANELPVTEPVWKIGYELPRWTTNKNWADQQRAAADRNMTIVTAVQDALMLNLVRTTGKCLRETTYSRTCTICDGYPLDVDSREDSVSVDQLWGPQDFRGYVGVSVQGVPLELGF